MPCKLFRLISQKTWLAFTAGLSRYILSQTATVVQGRLLLNLVLVRLGYPPALILNRNRDRYLRALRLADEGDFGSLGELLARAVLDNLYRFVIPAITDEDELIPLASLRRKDIKFNALRVAAKRGRLRALKTPEGQWLSTKEWVDDYIASRYKRWPDPDFQPRLK